MKVWPPPPPPVVLFGSPAFDLALRENEVWRKNARPAAKSAPHPFAPLLAELSKFVRKKYNVMAHATGAHGEKAKVPPAPWVQAARKAQRRFKEAERRKVRKLKKEKRVLVKVEWIGCEAPTCGKWRQLPAYAPPASFASPFLCEHLLFIDPRRASCAVPQQDSPHPFVETDVVDCVLSVLDNCGVPHPPPRRVVPSPPQRIAPPASAATKALSVKAESIKAGSVKAELAAFSSQLRPAPAAAAQAPPPPAGIKAFLFVKARSLPPHVVQQYTAPAAVFARPPPGLVAYTGEAAGAASRVLPAQHHSPPAAFTSGPAAAAPAPLAMLPALPPALPAHTTQRALPQVAQRAASSEGAAQHAAAAPPAPTSPLPSSAFNTLAGLADAAASSPPAAVPTAAAVGQMPRSNSAARENAS